MEFATFDRVVTDSRKAGGGDLFVAIKGDSFDGHDFVEAAVERGATGVVVREAFKPKGKIHGVTVLRVRDTETAYRRIGGAWRRLFDIPVVVVAGSVGKTTTKELVAAILQGKFKNILKTQGSQNGFVGIPMTLLDLRPEHDVAVVEVGIDDVGAMAEHMKLVAPSGAVLTAICAEHLERLVDLKTVAREESIALTMLEGKGTFAILNLDDEHIRRLAPVLKAERVFCFSLDSSYDSRGTMAAADYALHGGVSDGLLSLKGMGLDGVSFAPPLPGKHNARNLLAAVAIARALGLDAAEIKQGLRAFKSAGGRSEVVKLSDGTVFLCDYYNANPASMAAAFVLLADLAREISRGRNVLTKPRLVACLGDMLELGAGEAELHRELALKLMASAVDCAFLCGPRMKHLAGELKKKNFRGKIEYYDSQEKLAGALAAFVRPGDAVLIKGSRGMKMEIVWKTIKEINPEKFK